jgi:hypothetical protein
MFPHSLHKIFPVFTNVRILYQITGLFIGPIVYSAFTLTLYNNYLSKYVGSYLIISPPKYFPTHMLGVGNVAFNMLQYCNIITTLLYQFVIPRDTKCSCAAIHHIRRK